MEKIGRAGRIGANLRTERICMIKKIAMLGIETIQGICMMLIKQLKNIKFN